LQSETKVNKMTDSQPLVSIFTSCRNAEIYLEETLDSITNQTYRNLEIVIVDGNSTDKTKSIIEARALKDKRIKWISEPDNDATEGFLKALNLTSGKYVMFLAVSDLYIDKKWIEKCVGILEANKDISLVHGIPANIDENSSIVDIPVFSTLRHPLPSHIDFNAFYFATYCYVSELNYCVRRSVYLKCYPTQPVNHPKEDTKILKSPNPDPFLWFLLNFFKSGYLSAFVPVIACGGRLHSTSRNYKFRKYIKSLQYHYADEIKKSAKLFLSNPNGIQFLDSDSNICKTLNLSESIQFRFKIFYFKLTNLPMFGPRYTIRFVIYYFIKFLFENPKNLIQIIIKKIKSRLS